MDAVDRREAPVKIAIYEITSGITTYRWLCDTCVAARKTAGWTVKAPAPLPSGLPCSDCELKRQAEPRYQTPTVDYVPPDQNSRLPTRAEVARMRGAAPMKPWPKPKDERKRSA